MGDKVYNILDTAVEQGIKARDVLASVSHFWYHFIIRRNAGSNSKLHKALFLGERS